MAAGIVIAGTGQAGVQAAASLRQAGYDGEIVMIGDEPGLPYQRPPLSKSYLKDGNAASLSLRNQAYFDKNAIRIDDGVRIAVIDRAERRVLLHDGRHRSYDHLVLAVGARNRTLPLPGADLENVVGLRTRLDADDLRNRLATASHLIVVGGGFIGLELAAVARTLNVAVTVIEVAPRLMARVVSEPVSRHFLAAHRAEGAKVLLNAQVTRIIDDGRGAAGGVALADDTQIEGDLVVICAGVVPNDELAAQAGLPVANGIVVDSLLLTGDPAISAIGDCASFPHRASGARVRLESVQNAIDQAKCVARRLTGTGTPYDEVAWFWSDQGDRKLQIAGLTTGADRQVVAAEEEGRLVVHCFRDGRLIGLETVNAPREHMLARKLLGRSTTVAFEDLARNGFDLQAVGADQAALAG